MLIRVMIWINIPHFSIDKFYDCVYTIKVSNGNSIMEFETKQGAGCVIITKDSEKFLMMLRSEYVSDPNHWCWPGGMVDPGETPVEAAIRETWEETGIDLSKTEIKLIFKNETAAPHFVFWTFVAVIDKEIEPRLNWETQAHMWCNFDDAPEPRLSGAAIILSAPIARKRIINWLQAKKSA